MTYVIIKTIRSTRPTDEKRVWPYHTLLYGPKSLRHIFEFSLVHHLLNAKGIMPKYPTVFLQYFFQCKMSVTSPCHTLLGNPACLRKFIKLVWIIAYLDEKKLCKNGQHSSRKKIFTKNGRGPAMPRPSGWISMIGKIIKNIMDYIRIMEKYSSVSCNNFLNN